MTATVSDTLNQAADLIERRGWATGNCGMVATPDAPLCLEGAISAAMGLKAEPSFNIHGLKDGTPIYPYGARLDTTPAYLALLDYLERDAELWVWNDSYAHDAERVIEALRACAVVEASREREPAAQGVPS